MLLGQTRAKSNRLQRERTLRDDQTQIEPARLALTQPGPASRFPGGWSLIGAASCGSRRSRDPCAVATGRNGVAEPAETLAMISRSTLYNVMSVLCTR